jgi:formiminotetrahydrofolate cyclodeaminase
MRPMTGSAEQLADLTLGDFTKALASEEPTPGGGSAVALAASLASSLTVKVVRLSLDRPTYQGHAALHEEALAASDGARRRFLDLADEDAHAYSAYVESRRLPRERDDEKLVRAAAMRDAARQATTVPLTVVQLCHDMAELVERLAGRTNTNVSSDLDAAGLLFDAAARGAAANAVVNLDAVEDEGFSTAVLSELDQRLRQIQSAVARTRERVRKSSPRRPEAA